MEENLLKEAKIKKIEIRNRKIAKNLRIKEKIIQKETQAEMVQEVVVLILILLSELQEVYWED